MAERVGSFVKDGKGLKPNAGDEAMAKRHGLKPGKPSGDGEAGGGKKEVKKDARK